MAIFRPSLINTGRGEQLLSTLFFILLFLMGIVFSLGVNASSEAVSPSINLSESEQAWLAEHKKIRLAFEGDWPPYSFLNKKGEFEGLVVDYVKLLTDRLGIELEIYPDGNWDTLYEAAKRREVDIIPTMVKRSEREQWFAFSDPYVTLSNMLITRKDDERFNSRADMAGRTVALVRGYFHVYQILEDFPSITPYYVDNVLESLIAVSTGKADVTVESPGSVDYLTKQYGITNLKYPAVYAKDNAKQSFGVRKDWPELVSIINKALMSVTKQERQSIFNKWIPSIDIPEQEKGRVRLPEFTTEEMTWLAEHPNIRVGVMDAWPPFDFVGKDGSAKGIGVDYISALNQRLNGVLQIVSGPWKQIYEDVENRRLDALLDITAKPSREQTFNFTTPYLDIPHVIIASRGASYIRSEDDLRGMTIALEKGFGNVLYFQEKFPKVKIKQYQNTSTALDAVARGEADAYAGNRAVATYLMEKEVMVNLMVHGRMEKPGSILAIGTRKDWPILRDILQKAMDNISHSEKQSILRKWVEVEEKKVTKELLLSVEEKAWLDGYKKIRIGVDAAWPPVEWIDEEGKHHGMTSEYFALISDMLAIESAPVQGLSWIEIMKGAEQGEVDVISALVPSEERRKYLNFTSSYLSFPLVIFTRDRAPLVTKLRDLYGKRVAVEEGYVSYEYLQRDYPRINLTTYETTEEILRALSLGQVDAYIGNLTVAAHLIQKSGLTNIKVAAPTPYTFDLSIGVRKDWPELVPLLERALAMIDEEQRNTIRQHWLSLHYEKGVDYTLIKQVIAAAVVLILAIVFWMGFIQRQKRVLAVANAETDSLNQELMEANDKLKEMDKMKSMFIASISHELRTPLNSIIGFSSMMVDGSFGELNDKYQDYSTRINHSGQHLLALITDIIDISKIEAGRVDIVLGDFELADIVSDAVEELGQQIKRKSLSLEVNVPQNVAMHTDKRRLFQCLLNMLSNAMKYTEQGGIILTAEEQKDEVLLTIRDSGIGISDADLPRLFEAFERMKSHLQVKAGGTGLGLYLTKKIVTELLQGEVGVESKLGEGSTFWIRVPKTINPQAITMLEEEL